MYTVSNTHIHECINYIMTKIQENISMKKSFNLINDDWFPALGCKHSREGDGV